MCALLRKRRRPAPPSTLEPCGAALALDDATVRGWPLPPAVPPPTAPAPTMPPPLAASGAGPARGLLLVVDGARAISSAALLAANGALQAGAGQLTIACAASAVRPLALALSAARVIGIPESADGAVTCDTLAALLALGATARAVLIGPGLPAAAAAALARALLAPLAHAGVVLDAGGASILPTSEPPATATAGHTTTRLVTLCTDELAELSGSSRRQIASDPARHALEAARRWHAVIALHGTRSVVCAPDGSSWQHEDGHAGADHDRDRAGAGAALAGVIAGLIARGAGLAQAACWAIVVHAHARRQLNAGVPAGAPAGAPISEQRVLEAIPALIRHLAHQ
jgi:ADP-dependent NAD(P)H-hydrate dehydratase